MTTNDKNTQRFIVKLGNGAASIFVCPLRLPIHVYRRAKLFALLLFRPFGYPLLPHPGVSGCHTPPTTRRVRKTHGKQIPTLTPLRKDFILEASLSLFSFCNPDQRDIVDAQENCNFEFWMAYSNLGQRKQGSYNCLDVKRSGWGLRGDCDRTKNIFFR